MANLTLYQLYEILQTATDKLEKYSNDAADSSKAIKQAQEELKAFEAKLDEMNDKVSNRKSVIASHKDKRTLITAKRDGRLLSDFENQAGYDAAIAADNSMIQKETDAIESEEASLVIDTDAANKAKSDLEGVKAEIVKLQSNPIYKLLEQAQAAEKKAQSDYDNKKFEEEQAMTAGSYDLDPALKFNKIAHIKNAARITIINRAAKEALEEFALRHVNKGYNPVINHKSHPLELVSGYSNGIKWTGSNADDIGDAMTIGRAARDKANKQDGGIYNEKVQLEGREIFRSLVEKYNRETGSIAWTKDEAMELTNIAFHRQLDDSLGMSKPVTAADLDLWGHTAKLVMNYVDKMSRGLTELALALSAVEAHKAFDANVIKAYTAIASKASAEELVSAEWADIADSTKFAELGIQVNDMYEKAKNEYNDTLKLANVALDSIKSHSSYDNEYGCAYYENNAPRGATAERISVRHLDFSKLESMQFVSFITVYREYESENTLAGHPFSIGLSGPIAANVTEVWAGLESRTHLRINLLSSFKQISSTLTELNEFAESYIKKTQSSSLVQERVNSVLENVDENFIVERKKVVESLNCAFVDARVAKALSQVYSIKADEVSKRIRVAIQKGLESVIIEGRLEATIIKMLIDAKYTVSEVMDNINYETGEVESVQVRGRGGVEVVDIATIISWESAIADPKAAAKEGGNFENHAGIKVWNDAAILNNLGGGKFGKLKSIGEGDPLVESAIVAKAAAAE